jgi:hypothetical protein
LPNLTRPSIKLWFTPPPHGGLWGGGHEHLILLVLQSPAIVSGFYDFTMMR